MVRAHQRRGWPDRRARFQTVRAFSDERRAGPRPVLRSARPTESGADRFPMRSARSHHAEPGPGGPLPWHPPRVIARTARNHTVLYAATAIIDADSGRICEAIRAGIAVAFSRRVTARTSQRGSPNGRRSTSMTTSVEMAMRGLTTFARYLVRGALAVCVMSLGAPCAAQEVDPPTPPDCRRWTWLALRALGLGVVSAPVQKQIDLKLYGFYIGGLDTPVAQVDVPIRTTKFLTVTPSYMGYSVPASGLNKLPPQPGSFTDSYKEHQFRIDGTVAFAVRKLEISARNMYVRRFRPAPAGRYESLSRANCDRVSPRRSRPHLETVCLIRNLL